MQLVFIILLSVCLIGALIYGLHEHKLAKQTLQKNKEITEYNALQSNKKIELDEQINALTRLADVKRNEIDYLRSQELSAMEDNKALVSQAFENYCDALDVKYEEKAAEFDELSLRLDEAYAEKQAKIIAEIDNISNELEKIRLTRKSLIEAQIKEKEIQENKNFYCIIPTENDKDDIRRLERVKKDLHNPRILSMLIWQTFFQKAMTSLCNNVLGTTTVTGIYKITNLNNNMCYIGQAVDVAARWKDHAKCGLGIDTPAGNKLYAAMKEEGIWNFSWELLEKCDRKLLDEKEKYYIGIYQSKDFGYNTTKGNK